MEDEVRQPVGAAVDSKSTPGQHFFLPSYTSGCDIL